MMRACTGPLTGMRPLAIDALDDGSRPTIEVRKAGVCRAEVARPNSRGRGCVDCGGRSGLSNGAVRICASRRFEASRLQFIVGAEMIPRDRIAQVVWARVPGIPAIPVGVAALRASAHDPGHAECKGDCYAAGCPGSRTSLRPHSVEWSSLKLDRTFPAPRFP